MAEPVVIVPYDAAWPARFESEHVVLAAIFAGTGAVIEHVGSTAVPGLGAKPILDILLGVPDLSLVEARIAALEGHGYEYVPAYEAGIPDRRYFRKPKAGPRTHHLHGVVLESRFWRRHIALRDYLRVFPETAADYHDLKCALAARHGDDRVAYTEGKTAFIESVLKSAARRGYLVDE